MTFNDLIYIRFPIFLDNFLIAADTQGVSISVYNFMVARNRGLSSVKLDLGLVLRVIIRYIDFHLAADTSYKLALIGLHRPNEGGTFTFFLPN